MQTATMWSEIQFIFTIFAGNTVSVVKFVGWISFFVFQLFQAFTVSPLMQI